MKIVEYVLAYEDAINDLIRKGFQPYGSPFNASLMPRQAMVKYEQPAAPTELEVCEYCDNPTEYVYPETEAIALLQEQIKTLEYRVKLSCESYEKVMRDNVGLQEEIIRLIHKKPEITALSEADSLHVAEALINPPEPNEKLKGAFAQRPDVVNLPFKITPGKIVTHDDKGFLNEVIKENELLKEVITDLIEEYCRYHHKDGYFVLAGCDEYYDKDHENFAQNILKSILEHRKRLDKVK